MTATVETEEKQTLAPEISSACSAIRTLESRPFLSPAERRKLNFARLRLARWACYQEGIPASMTNLQVILGEAADEALRELPNLLRYMRAKERAHAAQ